MLSPLVADTLPLQIFYKEDLMTTEAKPGFGRHVTPPPTTPQTSRNQIPYRYGTHTGRRVGGKLANWLKVLLPTRKKGPADIAALEAAEAKRAHRRARNLRWWASDPGWHQEILASRTK